jgi:hypothetical protein
MNLITKFRNKKRTIKKPEKNQNEEVIMDESRNE